nr:ATP-dependent DNA helicase PIF1-like [Tanacetum cinerariifolium]
MPYPDQKYNMDGYNQLIFDETLYDTDKLKEQHVKLYGSLTSKQKDIYSIVMNAVDNDKCDSICHIAADSDLAELIRKAKLIIWDEAPMVNRHCYEAFDRTLRDICRTDTTVASDKVFGGEVVLFGGDF